MSNCFRWAPRPTELDEAKYPPEYIVFISAILPCSIKYMRAPNDNSELRASARVAASAHIFSLESEMTYNSEIFSASHRS